MKNDDEYEGVMQFWEREPEPTEMDELRAKLRRARETLDNYFRQQGELERELAKQSERAEAISVLEKCGSQVGVSIERSKEYGWIVMCDGVRLFAEYADTLPEAICKIRKGFIRRRATD